MPSYLVSYDHGQGYFDTLDIDASGLMRLEGWYSGADLAQMVPPRCFVDQQEVPLAQMFRMYRPDVAAHCQSADFFLGFACLYRLDSTAAGAHTGLKLIFNDQTILTVTDTFHSSAPHYKHLFDTSEVLHREHIYGFGPPSTTVTEEIGRVAQSLMGPALDFGCGSGVLVQFLRARGIEAYGIELARDPIIQSIAPEIREYITLYDGCLPLPFATGSFRSAIATEVIEHVPNHAEALAELARVVREQLIVTVPDIMSIPICSAHNVVPWHLLEGTHVNFFTQTSLQKTLRRYFTDVTIAKITPTITNGTKWFGSLVAICRK